MLKNQMWNRKRSAISLVLLTGTFRCLNASAFQPSLVSVAAVKQSRNARLSPRCDNAWLINQEACKNHQYNSLVRLTVYKNSSPDDGGENVKISELFNDKPFVPVSFSILMIICGGALGPFLDSYHSVFGVLQYDEPIKVALWGSESNPALITAWWVPELFGLAGIIIGWLYVFLDEIFETPKESCTPSAQRILVGISFFTFQYWLSGIMVASGVDREIILTIMSTLATFGFLALDGTTAGALTSVATAVGGPLIEVALLSASSSGYFQGGYHYNDLGETGFFPLWIVPVYFLGGPAVGNLARGFWNWLLCEESSANS